MSSYHPQGGGNEPTPPPSDKYINFVDKEVERILVANGYSEDGIGITKDDAMRVTDFGTIFQNSNIKWFREFGEFENISAKQQTAYFNGSKLRYLDLPQQTNQTASKLGQYADELRIVRMPNYLGIDNNSTIFQYCHQLEVFELGENVPTKAPTFAYSRRPQFAIPKASYDDYAASSAFSVFVAGDTYNTKGNLIPAEWVKYMYEDAPYLIEQLPYLDLQKRAFWTQAKLGSNFRLEFEFELTGYNFPLNSTIFGSSDSGGYIHLRCTNGSGSSATMYVSVNGYSTSKKISGVTTNTKHTFVLTPTSIITDGIESALPAEYTGNDSHGGGVGIGGVPLWSSNQRIFRNDNYGQYRFYRLKQYDGDTLVMDLVPAKINNDAEGLYDLVEHKWYAPYGAFENGFVD